MDDRSTTGGAKRAPRQTPTTPRAGASTPSAANDAWVGDPGGTAGNIAETSGGQQTSSGSHQPDGGLMGRVRERAAAQLTTQKERATDGLGTVANAVRQSTHQLREQRHDTVARYVEQAADQIERFSAGLRNKDIRQLFDDAQRLARRQPALFIGGAFALGLLGARFFKSSPSGDDWRRQPSGRFEHPGRRYATRPYDSESTATGSPMTPGLRDLPGTERY